MPSGLKVLLLAMLPVNELRGTIPLAVLVFNLPFYSAFILSVLGNMIPVFFLLWFWQSSFFFLAKKIKIFQKFFDWLFEKTKKRFYLKYQLLGDILLFLIVAVPLPFTGAWTGTLLASIFGIRYFKAALLIFLGILCAGIIVSLMTFGSSFIFN